MTSFASERLQVCGISKIFWYSSIRAKSGRAVLSLLFFSSSFLCVCGGFGVDVNSCPIPTHLAKPD